VQVFAVGSFSALWKHPVLVRDLLAKLFAMFMKNPTGSVESDQRGRD